MSTTMDADAVAGLAGSVHTASEARVREILDFIEARVAELAGR
jgi:hypothetical protein